MPREIKFRAWDGERMFLVNPVRWEEMSAFHEGDDYVKNAESVGWKLMQFTGLLDKNGQEIYEGDIVRLIFPRRTFPEGPIYVRYVSDPEGERVTTPAGSFEPFSWGDRSRPMPREYEVIGNIHENPELLGDQCEVKK